LGLARAKTEKIWGSPIFSRDWVMLSRNDLIQQHDRMMHLLGMKPYGLFQWLEELVGQERALELARDESIPHPPSTIDSNPQLSSSSSHSIILNDHRSSTLSYIAVQDDMDIDEDEVNRSPPTKRMRVQ
jgi:hypothetical protein